jgi:hypothetical protein
LFKTAYSSAVLSRAKYLSVLLNDPFSVKEIMITPL